MQLDQAMRGSFLRAQHTYIDLLQSGYKQMGGLSYLAEGETSDGAISLMQSHRLTVTVSGDVAFGQNHTAVREACQREQSLEDRGRETSERTDCGSLASYQWP